MVQPPLPHHQYGRVQGMEIVIIKIKIEMVNSLCWEEFLMTFDFNFALEPSSSSQSNWD